MNAIAVSAICLFVFGAVAVQFAAQLLRPYEKDSSGARRLLSLKEIVGVSGVGAVVIACIVISDTNPGFALVVAMYVIVPIIGLAMLVWWVFFAAVLTSCRRGEASREAS